MIYIVLILTLYAFSLNEKRLFYWISPILFLCIFVFFHYENPDYEHYKLYFLGLSNLDHFSEKIQFEISRIHYELGFVILSSLISYLHLPSYLSLFIVFFISFLLWLCAFFYLKDNYFLCLILYVSHVFIPLDQILIRQSISISLYVFIFVVFYHFYERNKLKSISFLGYLFPSIFHYSAIVAFVTPLIILFNRKKFFIILIVFSFFFGYFIGIGKVLHYLSYMVNNEWFSSYINSVYAKGLQIDSYRNIKLLFISLLIFSAWDYLREDLVYFNMAKLYLFGVSVAFIFSDIYILSFRLPLIFLVFSIFIMPKIINYFVGRKVGGFVIMLYSFAIFLRNIA